METPLTPLEFARRTRALYADREAVVDGALRLTYAQFFERCDRWSAALQRLGVQPGRPRRLHRAEHARAARVVLRRAADRRGPRADQLPADRRRLRLHHQPQRRDASSARTRTISTRVDRIREQLPGVEHFVALEGRARRAGSTTRRCSRDAPRGRSRGREIAETDLLTINYTSGTTSRPKGVMITHRNAYMNVVGTLLHLPMRMTRPLPVDAADVPRQRLDVRLDRHRGRAARTSACARSIRRASSSRSTRESRHACSAPRRPC